MSATGWLTLMILLFSLALIVAAFSIIHDGGRNWPLIAYRDEEESSDEE